MLNEELLKAESIAIMLDMQVAILKRLNAMGGSENEQVPQTGPSTNEQKHEAWSAFVLTGRSLVIALAITIGVVFVLVFFPWLVKLATWPFVVTKWLTTKPTVSLWGKTLMTKMPAWAWYMGTVLTTAWMATVAFFANYVARV